MILNLLTVLFIIAFLVKAADYIYLFQIKEYRADRFLAAIHDNGWWETFASRKKLPAKSSRNLMTASVTVILLCFWTYLVIIHPLALLASLILFAPLAFSFVFLGVALTGIGSLIKRRRIIARAARVFAGSGAVAIGITGSFGKTTTKEYLSLILSQKYPVAKTEENMNTDVGVALSILKNVHKGTKYFIAEMGAYRRGEIKAICDLVHPRYGIITGIGNQHLELFGSRENLIAAKKELLDSLPGNGKAYVHTDRKTADLLVAGVKPEVFYFENKGEESLTEPCVALARHLGVGEEEIAKALARIKSTAGKHTPVTGLKGCLIIDNSYNTSREGFLNTIRHLARYPDRTRYIVSRGIIELGREKKETYREIAGKLDAAKTTLLTTDPFFRTIAGERVRLFKNEKQLDRELEQIANKETVIAFEGKYNTGTITRMKHL